MIALIRAHGGTYSPELDRSCSHLVVSNLRPNGNTPVHSAKVEWAMRSNASCRSSIGDSPGSGGTIRIVWEGWLWDCAEFSGRFKEEQWDVEILQQPPLESDSYLARGT